MFTYEIETCMTHGLLVIITIVIPSFFSLQSVEESQLQHNFEIIVSLLFNNDNYIIRLKYIKILNCK